MQITISVPSKSFLVGEYLAISGGTSLVLNTAPRFQMIVTQKEGDGLCEGISAQSPAGIWLREHNHIYAGLNMKFVDPHGGKGGFGASTAQFLAVYLLSHLERTPSLQWPAHFLKDLWTNYRKEQVVPGEEQLNRNTLLPSGADLIGQVQGGISLFSGQPFHKEKLNWSFSEYDFCLIRTGEKLPTHEHLKEHQVKDLMSSSLPSQLDVVVRQVVQGLRLGNWQGFETGIREFNNHLIKNQLVATRTLELLEKFQGQSSILVSKGCGAMGADVIFLGFKKTEENHVMEFVDSLGLNAVAKSEHMSSGVKVEWESFEDIRSRIKPLYTKDTVSFPGEISL